jgi:hypothetical protein
VKRIDAVRLFGMTNLSIEAGIRRVEQEQRVDLGHIPAEKQPGDGFYAQFSEKLRNEAEMMQRHYAVFYCLENSIRELIIDRLQELYGSNWWDEHAPQAVRENCKKSRDKEVGAGFTPRSDQMIDYSTFGELGEIFKANADTFGEMFRDLTAVGRILANLNTLRGPIAHCKPLAGDEVTRLYLGMSDWFRQMS